ncbi:MAG: type I-B CRISPR-associated protein Cas7/Csh2 [Endomicrobia bacterium]|nr:type I-B CRISPR-associated protein Cas7/Csh2 [Endomicrobiia bacterium]
MNKKDENVKNRSELVFIYDVTDANPNGDVDENRPRIDDETRVNIVTDVRLKRTIRDYLYNFKKMEILVREIEYEPGRIQDAKLRAKDFLFVRSENKEIKKIEEDDIKREIGNDENKCLNKMKEIIENNILNDCIDVRLFGCTLPIEWDDKHKSSITFTGPVQFKFGRSLHRVSEKFIKGTGAFASVKEAGQKTFREEYVLYYSLICFYGIINENAAKETHLTEGDVELLLEAMWNGTKNLITRSKIGQIPRLLLQVIYKEGNYHIGELDKRIKLISEKRDEEIRRIEEVKLDITQLIEVLNKNKDKIEKIRYKIDNYLTLIKDKNIVEFRNCLSGIKLEEINFSENI